jgi:hypothetical protein
MFYFSSELKKTLGQQTYRALTKIKHLYIGPFKGIHKNAIAHCKGLDCFL